MDFVVVTSLLEIVEHQLLQPNPSLILYDKKIIVSLSHKLRFLQAFLEESGKKTNHLWEIFKAEIRDVAVKAEGKIESKLREIYVAANWEECEVACQGLHQTLKQIVEDIARVQTRVKQKASIASNLGSLPNDFKEENVVVGGTGTSQNSIETENEIIVGFNEDVAELVDRLKSKKEEVISLVGEGGIGKTTLAKIVFEHQYIIDHFDIRASAVVSQELNIKEMLVGLLRCIVPMTSEISNKEEDQLAEELVKRLMGRRYLIVLDDVWTTSAWDSIKGCFPDNENRSKIMITTRIYEVARYVSERPHNMKSQTPEKSWELFSRKVFREGYVCTHDLEQLGRQILHCCRGLPLAILVIAGLLSTVKGSLEIWTDVVGALRGMDSADDRISKILSLGYDYLPSRLKACFLYFGVFSEDSNILVKKIINLWVAEGILKPEKNKSPEGVAENCLLHLINRNLVQVNELSIDGKIKSCKIHDRLHEICVREAKRENITCVIDEKHAAIASRWMSCQSRCWPITRESFGTHTSKEIHSIFYFGRELYLSKCRLVYPCLILLRVLDLSIIKCLHGMPSGIVDLIHLRYLALSTIGSLYKVQFLKLKNLQTLNVRSWMEEYPLQLPCDILGLPQLRHLHLQKRCSQYLPSMVQENLQTLYWLKVSSSDQNPNFRMVPNLKELGIYIEGELMAGCLESLGHLHLLEKLKFEIGRVERFHLPTSFPSNLKKLTLRSTYLPWEEVGIIGKLPNLEVLKLKDFAFCGPDWEPKMGEFRVLKVLLIARSDLKQWKASIYHFPSLERLILRYCWDLKEVPHCFAEIGTMKLIMLDSCHSSLVASANQISSANKLMFEGMADCPLRVRQVGTKVELPNNESSEEEEESVESSGEESVESPEEKNVESPKEKNVESSKERSAESSKEESDVESSKGVSVESSDEERLKAQKSVMKYLKRKVSKSLNAFKELKRKVL